MRSSGGENLITSMLIQLQPMVWALQKHCHGSGGGFLHTGLGT